MTQLAPTAQGQPLGCTSHVPDAAYAYDIAHRSGLADITINITDIEGQLVFGDRTMGLSGVCPVDVGASLIANGDGLVTGFDMYGQYIEDAPGEFGVTSLAFAYVTSAPPGSTWVNQFGLPYAYLADAPMPNPDVTIAPGTPEGDARGMWTYDGDLSGPTEVRVPYIADQSKLYGEPYATRFGSGPMNSIDVPITVAIDAMGVVSFTPPAAIDGIAEGLSLYFPDGGRIFTTMGGPALTYPLSPLWLSQHGRGVQIEQTLNNLIAVEFDANEIRNTYAVVTAYGVFGAPEAGTVIEPNVEDAKSPGAWHSMTTHAAIDAYIADNAITVPDGWGSMSLTQKRAWLDAEAV